jgi:GntR family transcriptional regulator
VTARQGTMGPAANGDEEGAVRDLSVRVDRSSPVPLYYQVSRAIESAIERGELTPGAMLENETDLAKRMGLSRPTLRRAMQELVDKGVIVRKRGIGTQVVGTGQFRRQVQLTSLYDDLAETGQRPTTRLLVHRVEPADEAVAEQLGVEPGADVVHLKRLRYADGAPLAVMRNWLPMEVAGAYTAEQLEADGLYALLRGNGVHTRIATQRIGARDAEAEEAELLEVAEGTAVLTMERTTLDDGGRPVEFGRHSYRADTYSFEVVVVGR